jgi:hypothetical protein
LGDDVLAELGLVDRVKQATTTDELRRIIFDPNTSEVELAIRDALHPESGTKAAHFAFLDNKALKRVLKTRFNELKKQRAAELRNGAAGSTGGQSAHDWTDDLKLDKDGGVRPILHNLIVFLRHYRNGKAYLASTSSMRG